MKPLDGIRVVEWGMYHLGPGAGAMLADAGAEVIKLEKRLIGDPPRQDTNIMGVPIKPGGMNCYFEGLNRGKKGIALDWEKPAGKEIIYRLIEKSDVFLTNFRQRALNHFRFEYDILRTYNNKLIFARASGYGDKGPEADDPAFDLVGQGRSGLMMESMVSTRGIIPGSPAGIGDHIGSIALVYGILMALFARERTGMGQEVDVSLLGSLLWLQYTRLMVAAAEGQEARPGDRTKPVNPLANVYQAGDGKWICMHMGAISLKMWPSVCQVLGIEELVNDPRFCGLNEREEHSEELVRIMDERFKSRSASEWVQLAKEAGIVLSPINTLLELCDDPQVLLNEYVKEFTHPVSGKFKAPGYPVKLSLTPLQAQYPAPQLGQHTEEILTNIGGYTRAEINKLKQDEVI